jgi:hypothetical protein
MHHLACVTLRQAAGGKQLLIKPAPAQEIYDSIQKEIRHANSMFEATNTQGEDHA